MTIQEITILSGYDKNGYREGFDEISLRAGETVSIVGPTGSGKTALITDIELLAQGDTSSGRRILINGSAPDPSIRYNPALKPIAMITQNTKCFADLTVYEFLKIHARARGIRTQQVIEETIALGQYFYGRKDPKGTPRYRLIRWTDPLFNDCRCYSDRRRTDHLVR